MTQSERIDIRDRLARGERLLLDGATGSELQRRGVNLARGVTPEGELGVWSATAVIDGPEIVREVHEDYLRAGADIITTNSFWTNRYRLEMVDLGDKAEEYTRLAAELACDARDRLNPDAYVAGSLAPPGMPDLDFTAAYRTYATILAAAGVDCLLLEYVSTVAEAKQIMAAATGVGLPIFLGICDIQTDGAMRFGEPIDALLAALADRQTDAILPMCSKPEHISVILPQLRQQYAGPIGAYAEVGYARNVQKTEEKSGNGDQQWHLIDDSRYPPERYVEFAREWINMGAQIVGACCASTPAHIAAIRPLVTGNVADSS